MMFDADAVERFVKEGGGLGLDFGRKGGFEADEGFKLGGIHAEESLPGRVDVQIAAARAEGGDHLRGVIEQVAVALFAFAQGVLGATGGAQVDGDGDQTFNDAGRRADRREVNHGRESGAVLAAVAHLKAADAAGGKAGYIADVGQQRRSGFRWNFGLSSRTGACEAASWSPTRAISLSGKSSAAESWPTTSEARKPEHALGRGIEQGNAPGEIAGDHHGAGGIEDAAVQAGDPLQLALGLALPHGGAEAGQGDGDEQGLGESPEGGEPEDPGMVLGRSAAGACQHESSGEGEGQSDDKSSGYGPGLGQSGHSWIPWTFN